MAFRQYVQVEHKETIMERLEAQKTYMYSSRIIRILEPDFPSEAQILEEGSGQSETAYSFKSAWHSFSSPKKTRNWKRSLLGSQTPV